MKGKQKGCMHGSITDMIFSSNNTLSHSPQTLFSLLKTERNKLTCNYSISHIGVTSMFNLMLYVNKNTEDT